jgi:hypothetical protein
VDRVDPARGVTAGGDHITIIGSGFEPGKTQVDVHFGRTKVQQVVIASTDKISVVTPAGDRGPVDVTLAFNNGDAFKIAGGFHYVPPQARADVRKAFFTGQKKK